MKSIKEVLQEQGYSKIYRNLGISLAILTIVLILFLGYYLFIYLKPCSTRECYLSGIEKCSRYSWIKDDSQARWMYNINGADGNSRCNIDVTLVSLKQGGIDNEKLQGKSMICSVLKTEAENPEKDLVRCSGELKEGIQEIIIQRMHNYLLENFGEIKNEFKSQ